MTRISLKLNDAKIEIILVTRMLATPTIVPPVLAHSLFTFGKKLVIWVSSLTQSCCLTPRSQELPSDALHN